MDEVFLNEFPESLRNVSYNSYDEYIHDLLKQFNVVSDCYCLFYLKNQENIKTEQDKINLSLMVRQGIEDSNDYINSRFSKTKDKFFFFEYLKLIYKLNDLETFCLVVSLAKYVDSKYENTFSYLLDNEEIKSPTFDLAFKLFFFTTDLSSIDGICELKSSVMEKLSTLCFKNNNMELDDRLLSLIMSNGCADINIPGLFCYAPKEKENLLIRDDIANKISEVVNKNKKNNISVTYFYIHGKDGIGKKTQIERFAQLQNISVVFVDCSKIDIKDSNTFRESVLTMCRESILNQGSICFYNFEMILDEDKNLPADFILNTAGQFSGSVFILSNKDDINKKIIKNKCWIDINIQDLSKKESYKIWDKSISKIKVDENFDMFEMANKFNFTPGQIIGTIKEANNFLIWSGEESISKKDLCRCAYSQVSHDLKKRATLVYAKHTWDQLILPDSEKNMLSNACDQIRYRHIVYDDWGFNKRLSYGKGVSMLFTGLPGTGKTMAAQVVANELDLEIYKVDLSQIVSKYIGETEKNLNSLFEEAKKSNVILFFDETDALLGKRTQVKDSHDKNANLETSYLLQKMEEYEGITVLSTNYLENIDQAFFRRINYIIHFPFPDISSRELIWKSIFPKECPIDNKVDFKYLSKQFEISGGNIKNIALTASFLAAKKDKIINMEHIIKAICYELTKQGKVLTKDDIGEYAYLLK